jgi:pectin methylesterase-like acyl-CoA thioesterase
MVSESNPLTDITAASGEIGTVSYESTDTSCKVTIPMTAGETSLNYVLNIVQKPDFTLTYYGLDGTAIGTQTVEKDAEIGEFAVNIENVTGAQEGYKARGWFKQNYVGAKYKTTDAVTGNISLYAVETEIEVPSDSKKYTFDLTNVNFDDADHEGFNSIGSGIWHDNQHGWVFNNGDKIELLVGKKATVTLSLCKYSKGNPINASNGATIESDLVETDGGMQSIEYEGEAGTLTLTFNGTSYLHGITVLNTSSVNYIREGNTFTVFAGDASSFLDALDAANGSNGVAGAPRVYIYLPNGDYNLGERCLTPVSGNNISIIGESQEGVIIRNLPVAEGIGITATLKNSGTGNYYQDLTIKNEWDYYGRILAGDGAGRAVCIQETGNNTICKNVTLLSYQDTYYTNNANGNYYWEDSEIHGTVDFICGEGTLFMESSKLVVEKRNPDGSGECTLTAPSTAVGKNYGYVFNNCTIENNAAKYNFGRAWNNEPRCAYLNTTVKDNKINTNRWTPNGMNVVAKEFVEYNTKDEQGSVVSPASHVVTFTYGSKSNEMETILTADQAANFTLAKVFGNWGPDNATKQVEAPQNGKMEGNTISWDAVTGAVAYFIYDKEGKLMGETTETTYTIEDQAAGSKGFETTETVLADSYIVRAANAMGGLGEPAIISKATAITDVNSEVNGNVVKTELYNLQGVRVVKNYKGAAIRVQTMDNGQTTTQKVIMK